jgi:hypothetical protein
MHFHNLSISEIYIFDKIPFSLPRGKPMTPHLLRYQGLAVDDYSFVPELVEGLVEGLPWIWGILNFRSIRVQIYDEIV